MSKPKGKVEGVAKLEPKTFFAFYRWIVEGKEALYDAGQEARSQAIQRMNRKKTNLAAARKQKAIEIFRQLGAPVATQEAREHVRQQLNAWIIDNDPDARLVTSDRTIERYLANK